MRHDEPTETRQRTEREAGPLCIQFEVCLDPGGDHRDCPGSGDGECHGPRDCTGTSVGCRHCEAGMYPALASDPVMQAQVGLSITSDPPNWPDEMDVAGDAVSDG